MNICWSQEGYIPGHTHMQPEESRVPWICCVVVRDWSQLLIGISLHVPSQIYEHRKMNHEFPSRFSGRIQWNGSKDMQDVSITVLNVTLNDSGIYTCNITREFEFEIHRPLFTSSRLIHLTVVEEGMEGWQKSCRVLTGRGCFIQGQDFYCIAGGGWLSCQAVVSSRGFHFLWSEPSPLPWWLTGATAQILPGYSQLLLPHFHPLPLWTHSPFWFQSLASPFLCTALLSYHCSWFCPVLC